MEFKTAGNCEHPENFNVLELGDDNYLIVFRLYAFVGFDYFSFCIFIEKYNADDDMKHVLKEKVSYCQVPPTMLATP
jgi:hypothetical protein